MWDIAADAMFQKGSVYAHAGRFDDAIEIFGEVIETFDGSPYRAVHVSIASAIFNTGLIKAQQKDWRSASTCLSEVERMYASWTDIPEMRELVAKARQMHARVKGPLGWLR
jgi:TolA-binding protein